jgi:ABC-type transporter Mla MlaB component
VIRLHSFDKNTIKQQIASKNHEPAKSGTPIAFSRLHWKRLGSLQVLRISPAQSSAGLITLTLEGRLLGPWVAELESAITATGFPPARVRLDLSGVQYADASGVDLLQRLSRQGVHLEALSPFIRELVCTPAYRDSDFTGRGTGGERAASEPGKNP